MIEVKKYSSEYRNDWDNFVELSKNGSFHLKRDFVEYHSSRFTDYSLMIFEDKELKAVVPANIRDSIVYSHQGLTYGGILVEKKIYLTSYIEIVKALFGFLKGNNIERLIIKEIPWTYTSVFNDDFDFLVNVAGAKISRFDVLPHIDLSSPLEYQTRRKRSIAKAKKSGFMVKETPDYTAYWNLVTELLAGYGAAPVHSLEEITYLKAKFPENIRLFEIWEQEQLIAGVLVFETTLVARAQYIASSALGKETGALDLLFDNLITIVFKHKKYFEFGTTTLNGGTRLNYGLSDQKEGFGARSVVQHTYDIDIKNLDVNKITELKL